LDKHTISAVRLNKLNPDDHLHGNKLDKDGDGNIEAAEVQAFLGVKN